MTKTNQELIEQKNLKVQEQLGQQNFLTQYTLDTLAQFSHRYFDEASKAEILADGIIRVTALEKGIKEAIKIKNQELRNGIGELVKRVSKDQGPTILRELRVEFLNKQCRVTARISFGHPEHLFEKGSYVEKLSMMNFDDELHFRNILAKYLEGVSELFL